MNVIASGRKTSRTTRLIERAVDLHDEGKFGYIVCHSVDEVQRVWQKVRELGLLDKVSYPISHYEFVECRYVGQNIDFFLIDNADYLLQSLTPVPIDTIVVYKKTSTSEL
jgi:hypothetical protein